MRCYKYNNTEPESLQKMCCCICNNRLIIKQCTCGRCFSSKVKPDFKYICLAFRPEGYATPSEEHGICEEFELRTRNRNEDEDPVVSNISLNEGNNE